MSIEPLGGKRSHSPDPTPAASSSSSSSSSSSGSALKRRVITVEDPTDLPRGVGFFFTTEQSPQVEKHETDPSAPRFANPSSSSSAPGTAPAVSKEQQVKECLNTLALIGYDYKPGSLARVHQHFNQLKTFRDVKFTYLIVKSRYYFRLAQAYAHDAHLYANTSHPDWSLQRLTQAIEALKKIKGELMGPWPSRIASFLVMLLKKKFHNCWRESNHPQAREFLIEIREIEGKTEMPLVDYAQKLFNEFNSQS